MHFHTSLIAANALISVVFAATFNVAVGQNNQNVFNPPFLTGVQNGDTISFQFVSKTSHSVTQSTLDSPCTRKPNGIDSGLLNAVNSNLGYTTTISDASTPSWFFCILHCRLGMVFAINPSAADFATFSAVAKGATPPPSSTTTLSAAPSIISSTSTTAGTTSLAAPLTLSSSISPTSTTPSTSPTATSSTSSNVNPTAAAGGALGQVSADKVALWLSILGVVVGLIL